MNSMHDLWAWKGVGFGGTGMLWACPLTPGRTQGGIGAAHGPREKLHRGIGIFPDLRTNPEGIGAAHGLQEKICGDIGVPPDLKTNPRRYPGRPWARGENMCGYKDVPSPRPTQGGMGAAHGPREQIRGSNGVSRDP